MTKQRISGVLRACMVGACVVFAGCSGSDGPQGPAGPTGETGTSSGSVSGKVTNELTTTGLADVTVTASSGGATTTTGADGTYTMDLPIGPYTLVFTQEGFDEAAEAIDIVAGGTATLDVAMTPPEAVVIELTLTDGSDGSATDALTLGDSAPGTTLSAEAVVTTYDGSVVTAYAWSWVTDSGATPEISTPTEPTTDVTLAPWSSADGPSYKDSLIEVIGTPGDGLGGPDYDPSQHALPDRAMIVPVNPYTLDKGSETTIQVTVTAGDNTYTKAALIAVDLSQWAAVSGGQQDVPPNKPMIVQAEAQVGGTYAWTIDCPGTTAPPLGDTDTRYVTLTPTAEAQGCTLTESATGAEIEFIVREYAGRNVNDTGSCTSCHGVFAVPIQAEFDAWTLSGHSMAFEDLINVPAPEGHFRESCFPCHTAGDDGYDDNGFSNQPQYDDFLAQFWPEGKLIQVVPDQTNYVTMEDSYPTLYSRANITCENCHGPHGNAGGVVDMAADVCGTCHGAPTRHGRFEEWQLAGHSNFNTTRFAERSGLPRDPCAQCHSAQGFIWYTDHGTTDDFPADLFSSTGGRQPQSCVTCHDPHNAGTTTGLGTDAPMRGTYNKVVVTDAGWTLYDAGKSGICMSCHNARRGGWEEGIKNGDVPHHGTQGDVVQGQNAAVFFGVPMPGGHSLLSDSCVECHMRQITPPSPYGREGQTNHTWFVSEELTGENLCAHCHSDKHIGIMERVPLLIELLHEKLTPAWGQALNNLSNSQVVSDAGGFCFLNSSDEIVVINPGDALTEVSYASGFRVSFTHDGTAYANVDMGETYLGNTAADCSDPVSPDPDTRVGVLTDDDSLAVLWVAAAATWDHELVGEDNSKGAHNPTFVTNVTTANIDNIDAFVAP